VKEVSSVADFQQGQRVVIVHGELSGIVGTLGHGPDDEGTWRLEHLDFSQMHRPQLRVPSDMIAAIEPIIEVSATEPEPGSAAEVLTAKLKAMGVAAEPTEGTSVAATESASGEQTTESAAAAINELAASLGKRKGKAAATEEATSTASDVPAS
jgi:hypothetical protein